MQSKYYCSRDGSFDFIRVSLNIYSRLDVSINLAGSSGSSSSSGSRPKKYGIKFLKGGDIMRESESGGGT